MRRRVRWGNVGRLAGGVAVVALVAGWPRLAGEAPVVPRGVAVPVEVDDEVVPPGKPLRVERPRKMNGGKGGRRDPPKRKPPKDEMPVIDLAEAVEPPIPSPAVKPTPTRAAEPPAAVAPPPAPVAVEPPPRPPPTVDPAELEFGFER
jgi:hypothetical protein